KRLTNTFCRLMQPFLLMCRRMVNQIRALLALLVPVFFAVHTVGQLGTTTLRGKVSDTYGHAVDGAQVLLYMGVHDEVSSTALSDRLGEFEFAHLVPASDYRLRVVRAGYVSIEAAGISLQAGQSKQLQVTLDPRRALSNAVSEINAEGLRQQVRTLPVR